MGVLQDGDLVGYVLIELPNLIDYFLKDAEENFASGAAVVPRKLASLTCCSCQVYGCHYKYKGWNCSVERNFKTKIRILD